MAWRFRRSRSLGPFRFTLSKRGIGVSLGVRGAHVGLGADGKSRATFSLPSTGISYQTTGNPRTSLARVLLILMGIVAFVAAGAALLLCGAGIVGCTMPDPAPTAPATLVLSAPPS
jgi:hypothetical protein